MKAGIPMRSSLSGQSIVAVRDYGRSRSLSVDKTAMPRSIVGGRQESMSMAPHAAISLRAAEDGLA